MSTTRSRPVRERRYRGSTPTLLDTSAAAQVLVATLILALVMRLVVSLLGLPTILNFAFFPLLVFGNLLVQGRRGTVESRVTIAITVVSLAVAAATLTTFSSPFAAALLWASLATPFLVIRLAVAQEHGRRGQPVERLVLVFLLIQGAAIAFERAVLGQAGDAAQGFLRNQGAGHHVVGLIGIGTAMYLTMRLIEEAHARRQRLLYLGVGAGVAIGLITTTYQSFLAAAVVAIPYLIFRRSRWPLVVSGAATTLLLLVVLLSWPAFTPPNFNWYGEEYLANKGHAIAAVWAEYETAPYQALFGLGPGESATKVAWTGAQGFSNLTTYLGIEPGEVGGYLESLERAKPVTRTSSLTSPWSTWIGVFGDLGIAGLVAYTWAWVAIALAARRRGDRRLAGAYLVLYLVVLGAFYNWLEEPILTIFLGLAVADALFRAVEPEQSARDADSGTALSIA